MELEVFVHGALCIAYSGRCLLSGYFNHRDPNQGTCTNACRWNYATHDADIDPPRAKPSRRRWKAISTSRPRSKRPSRRFAPPPAAAAPPQGRQGLPDRRSRPPGQLMPIMEDEHGTYIMNSKDLRAVEHVARLTQIGVDSLKIEGRTKEPVLRGPHRPGLPPRHRRRRGGPPLQPRAADRAGRPVQPRLHRRLCWSAAPATTTRTTSAATPSPSAASTWARCWAPRALPEAGLSGDWVLVETKNHFAVGDLIEWCTPAATPPMRLQEMRNVEGQPVQVAQGSPVRVWIPLPGMVARSLTCPGPPVHRGGSGPECVQFPPPGVAGIASAGGRWATPPFIAPAMSIQMDPPQPQFAAVASWLKPPCSGKTCCWARTRVSSGAGAPWHGGSRRVVFHPTTPNPATLGTPALPEGARSGAGGPRSASPRAKGCKARPSPLRRPKRPCEWRGVAVPPALHPHLPCCGCCHGSSHSPAGAACHAGLLRAGAATDLLHRSGGDGAAPGVPGRWGARPLRQTPTCLRRNPGW